MYFGWLHKKTTENCSQNVNKKRFFGSVSGSRTFVDYSERSSFSFSYGSLRGLYQHKLIYFGWLHKKSPEDCSINVLKKSFLGRFRVLELLSTTRNDRFFLFPKVLQVAYISINLFILDNYPRKHPNIAVSMSSKKVFWVGFGFSNFFRLLGTIEFFFFLRIFKRLISA